MKFADKLNFSKIPEIKNVLKANTTLNRMLYQKGTQIKYISPRLLYEIECLKMTANYFTYVSMSANQVGFTSTFFIIRKLLKNNQWKGYDPKGEFNVYLNATVTEHSLFKQVQLEKCASYPFQIGKVIRSEYCKVQYKNLKFEQITDELKLLILISESRVFQHECDHIQGITFESEERNGGKLYTDLMNVDSEEMERETTDIEEQEENLRIMEKTTNSTYQNQLNRQQQQSKGKKKE